MICAACSGSSASATAPISLVWNASSAARSRICPTGHAATRDKMGAETREPMVDLTSHGVSFALLQGQLLAGEISRSAFLDRASLARNVPAANTNGMF